MNSNPREPAHPPLNILKTPAGIRFGIWGEKPSAPAPLLMVFATSLEAMTTAPVYSEVGRHLAQHGFISVTIDPPCHGADARAGEPGELQGWRARVEKGGDLIGEFNLRARSVLDHLIREGYADPNQIAACGNSRGGFLAYHFAAAEPRIKAVAGFSPVTNLPALREFEGMAQHEGTKKLALVEQATRLADRPVWLSIGNHDERVSTDDAITFARRVTAAHQARPESKDLPSRVTLIVGPSRGHSMIDNAHRLAADWFLRQFDIAARTSE
jgi:dienelactone hydrolase